MLYFQIGKLQYILKVWVVCIQYIPVRFQVIFIFRSSPDYIRSGLPPTSVVLNRILHLPRLIITRSGQTRIHDMAQEDTARLGDQHMGQALMLMFLQASLIECACVCLRDIVKRTAVPKALQLAP